MRKSRQTNTLVLVSNHTKSLYEDVWIGDTFHYTGTVMPLGPICICGDHDAHLPRAMAAQYLRTIDHQARLAWSPGHAAFIAGLTSP
jgi:hypothetical protein